MLGAGRSVDRNVFNESLSPVKCLLSSRIFVAVEVQVELIIQRTTSERWKVHRYCRGNEMSPRVAPCPRAPNNFIFFCLSIVRSQNVVPVLNLFLNNAMSRVGLLCCFFFVSSIFRISVSNAEKISRFARFIVKRGAYCRLSSCPEAEW